MNECCSNCRLCLRLTKYDYSGKGCEHTKLDGFACLAFAGEGDAIWMVGLDPDKEMCECWKERKK